MEHILEKLDLEKTGLRRQVDAGIEANRKGTFALRVTDQHGQPVPGAAIELAQVSHDFRFGCNSFMLDGFPNAGMNETYERLFGELFNLAVVPFFWGDYEPEEGKFRFDANSEKRYRRPTPDRVLQFCREHDILPKAHNLIYNRDFALPNWLPKDRSDVFGWVEKYFRAVAGRYAGQVPIWDVANEVLTRKADEIMPQGYLYDTYRLAGELFPKDSLFVNEDSRVSWLDFWWDTSPYYFYIDAMLQRGLRVDGIGMQYHLFYPRENLATSAASMLDAERILQVLWQYNRFGRPIHISEITLPAYGTSAREEEFQARLAENLYRLWFSQPGVEAIVWWNFVDGYAHVLPNWDENSYYGGLTRKDLTPKPVYQVLERLIKQEWRTAANMSSDAAGNAAFRGFYGRYQAKVSCGGQVATVELDCAKGSDEVKEIRLG